MAQSGNGTTIACGTSGFTASYVEVVLPEESVPVLDDSDLSSSRATYLPGDLVGTGVTTVRFWYDSSTPPPMTKVVETITITLPKKAGQANGATIAGTAFFSRRQGPTLANNTLMQGEADIQFTGRTGPTFTAGS